MAKRIKRPKIAPTAPGLRAPKGWNFTETSIRGRPSAVAVGSSRMQPAGNPPADWPGTRPEWAVYWALTQRGLKDGIDFIYQKKTQGVEISYYSTLDFYLPDYRLGIEVQGVFWHINLGAKAQQADILREIYFAGIGIRVAQIQEEDALYDPIGAVDKAISQA